MPIKRIIIFAGLAVGSFAGSFALTYLLSPAPAPPRRTGPEQAPATQPASGALPWAAAIIPKEKEMTELVHELQAKLADYRRKEQRLEEWEQRIHLTQQDLQNQAEELEGLRVQLVAPLNSLREAREELLRTRVLVSKREQENLKFLAARYDKMDSVSSSRILTEMCASNQANDAAKLLYYMSERPAAKLLAEIPDKALAARLSEMIKRIQEEG